MSSKYLVYILDLFFLNFNFKCNKLLHSQVPFWTLVHCEVAKPITFLSELNVNQNIMNESVDNFSTFSNIFSPSLAFYTDLHTFYFVSWLTEVCDCIWKVSYTYMYMNVGSNYGKPSENHVWSLSRIRHLFLSLHWIPPFMQCKMTKFVKILSARQNFYFFFLFFSLFFFSFFPFIFFLFFFFFLFLYSFPFLFPFFCLLSLWCGKYYKRH